MLQNSKTFLLNLLEYIQTHLPEKGDDVDKIKNTTMALHAVNNLILNTPGIIS